MNDLWFYKNTDINKSIFFGFTLIELLITLSLASILFMIAYPAYRAYLYQSNRKDAIVSLLNLEASQENYRISHTTYGTLIQLNASGTSMNTYYNLSISGISANGYTLTATAIPGTIQASDTGCTTISLTVSHSVATKTPGNCWN